VSEQEVLQDLSASKWLKQIIMYSRDRDTVDCLNDVDVLKSLLEQRMQSQLESVKE
jgi:hypothetical protein